MPRRSARVAPEAQPPPQPPLTMVMDTETTGLPRRSATFSVSDYDHARLVQWSWGLFDSSGTETESGNYIIRPEGFVIPAESTAIHGISHEVATDNGIDFVMAYAAFLGALERCHVIVGHNIQFDINVLRSEFMRRDLSTRVLDQRGTVCTMQNSKNLCQIPWRGGGDYKYPSLRETYRYFFGADPEGRLHDSSVDVRVTAACYFALLRREAPHATLNPGAIAAAAVE